MLSPRTWRLIQICGLCVYAPFFMSRTFWQSGWRHYGLGGGVYVHSAIVPVEMEKALRDFEWAGRFNPLSADAYNYQGKALSHLGRYEEAIGRFGATLRISPHNLTARYGRAYAYMKLGREQELVSELRRAFDIEPDLDSKVRFSEDFAHLRGEPFMGEFRSRMRDDP